MFKKSPVRFLTAAMTLLSMIAACSPAASAVDPVSCFNSEAVVITKGNVRFGIVPKLATNDLFFYEPLQQAGNFDEIAYVLEVSKNFKYNGKIMDRKADGKLVIAPDGHTYVYSGYISVRNVGGAMVIVKGGVEETCVPKIPVVAVDNRYSGWSISEDPQGINTCGNEAKTGDRIILDFNGTSYFQLILLHKAKGGFTYSINGEEVFVESSQGIFHFLAEADDGVQTHQTDVSVCYKDNMIGVERVDEVIGRSVETSIIGKVSDLRSWEIVDSNVCRVTDIVRIVVKMVAYETISGRHWFYGRYEYGTESEKAVYFELYKETGDMKVKADWADHNRYIDIGYHDLPPGKAMLFTYWDGSEGNERELLIENCGTFLSIR